MDAWSDETVETIVFMKSAQVGATECLGNCFGHIIDIDPGPTLVIQPTLELASVWSKDRLAPMLRDTPTLQGRVRDRRSKDSDNTILHKTFDGGFIAIGGANSAAGLASRPIRYLFGDEVDRYPVSAGAEGDPISLAEKRTTAFWNRKKFYASTPTTKGSSRIESLFEQSDQQRYYVPCPECGEFQRLQWAQMQWDKDDAGEHDPESAYYACEFCGACIGNEHKQAMLEAGEWRPSADFDGTRGFHINELYSPFVTWSEMVAAFLKARRLPETLKTFVNTSLAETWEEETDRPDAEQLAARAEVYDQAPAEVLFVTLSIDVQNDRLEGELLGWGNLFESWSLDHITILGDPTLPLRSENSPWNDLDALLRTPIKREDGRAMSVAAACIDSGHHTDEVYKFCKPRYGRRVYAIKGAADGPIVGRVSRNNRRNCPLFTVNVDQAKDRFFNWLSIDEPGPGYCHWPDRYDPEYFAQLAAEEKIERMVRGQRVRSYKQVRTRNEALDLRVYNIIACEMLNPNWDALLAQNVPAPKEAKPEKNAQPATVMQNKPRSKSRGWMSKRTRR